MSLVSKTFSDIITFTRASGATYFDNTGTLRTASTNVPRFDYNPSTLAARGLLIEESRTNLLLQSADFGTTWGPWQLTIATNVTLSPDGGNNADKFQEVAVVQEHYNRQLLTGLTANSTYTVSVFVKASERKRCRIRVLDTDNVANGYTAIFDVQTGTASGAVATGAATLVGSSITSVGNGWYRCSISGNGGATCTKYTVDFFTLLDTGGDTYLGVTGSGLFFWGAQCELGAFPTSYIPTTTTALTRAADVANVNTVAPWYNATEGTLYVQAQDMSDAAHATSQPRAASLNDATTSNTIEISRLPASAQGRAQIVVATVNQFNSLNTAWPLATQAKIALAYKANDYAACLGGGTVFTNTASSLIPTVTALSIGDVRTTVSNHWVGWIQRVAYYPRRLSNAELQAITA